MFESNVTQATIAIYYFIAGICFSILFDLFLLSQKIFGNPKWLIILEDTIFWIIVTIVIFIMNFNMFNGEIIGYPILTLAIGVALYIIIIRIFIKRNLLKLDK